jgi:glycosyltransferase involved in cell wall biosynthesis
MVSGPAILLCLPTLNEAGNIQVMLGQIIDLGLDADIVVIDDGSSDGTDVLVEEVATKHPQVRLIERGARLGIGSAHTDALRLGKKGGYQFLVTMDADFSHQPSDIPRLLESAKTSNIVVGSRFSRPDSLKEWNLFRKGMTHFGHFLTKVLLSLPYDASGGFRVYRLGKLSPELIDSIQCRNYEFFFESLTLMHRSGLSVAEVPIDLPARTYGESKMELKHIFGGVSRLFQLAWRLRFGGAKTEGSWNGNADFPSFRSDELRDEWDTYWAGPGHVRAERRLFDVGAQFYRRYLIGPFLTRLLGREFARGSKLLHAGCGSGEVDKKVVSEFQVTALDISPNALSLYRSCNAGVETVIGNIFDLSALSGKFDGIYNLGVMEHFSPQEIADILKQFDRALKPGGKLVLLWPPVYGLSVLALHGIHFVLNKIMRRDIQLHPPEPTKVSSRAQVTSYLDAAGFRLRSLAFGPRDAFTYFVLVADRK